ncbi:acetate--CoA ligase alpha subunit [Archaeoglobus fulgidus]|uniref:Acetate--CoA ligase [ADP-forming] I n=1 Tax=Archaeoglobus fulgidus (strain ATCC 49558 / DSM 4304 / JCM 9628 / NBRC 100126 / VC-16) TaxID=224325 RepID=ACD1_ARCFU|nr:acetate--CoA ligase [Archaeoglobus fulgidus]O29057.1 RecName: Full=Acetate--CoA ligase [ADP-forming] I; AltName: Full=ADP-forming acetyl coenzyme A synthetase I; Short=ACS I [Archaeoglobus fulgidus DSM 4304]AAB90033.1 conserved hypothetical protein [Archaeoglobus fulgidus DSM 4304]
MERLFYPKVVAVIGASPQEGKVGNTIMKNLRNFSGTVYAVNPKYREILGFPCYPSVLKIPENVDLAIIVVPAKLVPKAVEECGRKDVEGAVVISAGFKEAGIEGAKLERELVEVAERYGVKLVGPNCLGMINTEIAMNATFSRVAPEKGRIAFLSQSGAFILAVLEWSKRNGVGFSKVVSLGNKAMLDESDFLEYLAKDDSTDVILIYMEGVEDGRKFMRVAKSVARRKPVVVMKAGKSQSGAKAASSHTGSLAGSYEAYRAAFRQSGVIEASSVEELFDFALLLLKYRKAGNLAILTNSGGPGVMAADACDQFGVPLANFNFETIRKLKEFLPAESNFYNPVDILGDASAERFSRSLQILSEDENVDIVLTILTPTAQMDFLKAAESVVGKNAVCCFMGGESVDESERILRSSGIPNFFDPVRAVRAISVLGRYSKISAKERVKEDLDVSVEREKAEEIIEKLLESGGRVVGAEGLPVLEAYGIEVAPYGIARNVDEARDIAESIGYPVVLKVVSPDVVHKSDVGGVKLNVGENDLEKAFFEILSNVEGRMPKARIEGVLVQKMVDGGKELIVGMKRDPQFGPMIMFGMGGVYVEVLKDVSFRIAPITRREAHEMVREVKAYRILRGLRGEKPADIDAIADLLLRVSKLSLDHPEVLEMDLNPVKVFESGYAVVDFRMVLGEEV